MIVYCQVMVNALRITIEVIFFRRSYLSQISSLYSQFERIILVQKGEDVQA